MGDVDGGELGFFAYAANFGPHFEAEFRVEVRKGFVKEQALGFDDESSRESDPLLLAAAQLGGFVVGAIGHLHHREGFVDALGHFGFADFTHFESESDVLADAHMRP